MKYNKENIQAMQASEDVLKKEWNNGADKRWNETKRSPLHKLIGSLSKEEAVELRESIKDLRERVSKEVEKSTSKI